MPNKNKQEIKLNFSKIEPGPELEAFSNIFYYHSDDYFHNKIGSLFGIIQVLDHSEQSEYIPNLLTSVIKKEFYSQPKRATEESFEVALKKANLALADLAEHDIVNWNNKLHAMVGVFNNNTLYFTQVGNASIFLGRENKLLNLSENNPTPAPHPIKTFQDIIVGEISDQDKIIFAGPTIYNVFTFGDLVRLFDTFNSEEFDNLILKTIEKESPDTTILIINSEAKPEQLPDEQTLNNKENATDNDKPESEIDNLIKDRNFLGEEIRGSKKNKEDNKDTLRKTTKQKGGGKIEENREKQREKKMLTQKSEKEMEEKTGKKTAESIGTIPKEKEKEKENENKKKKENIKQATNQEKDELRKSTATKEKIKEEIRPRVANAPLTELARAKFPKKKKSDEAKKRSSKIKNALIEKPIGNDKHNVKKIDGLKPKKKKAVKKELSPFEQTPEIYISSEDEEMEKKASKKFPKKKLKSFFGANDAKIVKKSLSPKIEKSYSADTEKKEKEKEILPINQPKTPQTIELKTENVPKSFGNLTKKMQRYLLWWIKLLKKYSQLILSKSGELKQMLFKKKVFSKQFIGNAFSPNNIKSVGLTAKKKIASVDFKNIDLNKIIKFLKKHRVVIGLILFLVLTPLIISQITKKHQTTDTKNNQIKTRPPIEQKTSRIQNLNPNKTIITLPEEINLISGNSDVILSYGKMGRLYEISLKDRKTTTVNIPTNIKLDDIKSITYMSDLNLFFLSSDSQILSYSPVTHKFYKNKISLPDQLDLIDQGTYLDYLYLLDKHSRQIYRYPRDTGGFGKQKIWLKTPLPAEKNPVAMAVDDTIRLVYRNGKVETYFKNKLAKTTTLPTKDLQTIYTKTNLNNYYILDKGAGKILQVSKETDKVTREYQNENIPKANNIFIDEANKKIYFFNDKNLNSIDL